MSIRVSGLAFFIAFLVISSVSAYRASIVYMGAGTGEEEEIRTGPWILAFNSAI